LHYRDREAMFLLAGYAGKELYQIMVCRDYTPKRDRNQYIFAPERAYIVSFVRLMPFCGGIAGIGTLCCG